MTDQEISRKLALSIGWSEHDITSFDGHRISVYVDHPSERPAFGRWRVFDYRDPAVIWPIADRYDAFPSKIAGNKWALYAHSSTSRLIYADTAAKAVAMAVIGGRNECARVVAQG